ncbi:MAG TPA: acetylglutamate kinase [Chitinophagales bacterium]|nr:acetylglutamate kinase [Chitinophagales bacterium]HNL84229.1 acetylglutamate kinase [Chitinophagales bacterium]
MKELVILKIGGNVIDDMDKCNLFLENFAQIKQAKILIHGGGKVATSLLTKLGIETKMIDGRRITDRQTVDIVTMVYAGLINKKIVAKLQAENCNAIGLSGADANAVLAHKRVHPTIDYGFVGDIDSVNIELLNQFLQQSLTPVLAPITHDKQGNLLNTNADTMAAALAIAMAKYYKVTLIYAFEKNGLLKDVEDENSVIKLVNVKEVQQLKEKQIISGGMIPKVDNIVYVLLHDVEKVILCKAENIADVLNGNPIFGTTFIK